MLQEESDNVGKGDDMHQLLSPRHARDNSIDDCKLAHDHQKMYAKFDVPFGCAKSPFSTPDLIALLN